VKPQIERLNGHDVRAFIVSENCNRRDLTKGQKAMALAKIYPEPEKGGRGKTSEAKKALVSGGFSRQRLDQARTVLHHSLALADLVVAGHLSLDAALDQVQEEQKRSNSIEKLLATLQQDAPDLAELVSEERLTVEEAWSAYKQHKAEAEAAEASKRETMLRLGQSAWNATTAWASAEFVAELETRLNEDDEFRELWLDRVRSDPARLAGMHPIKRKIRWWMALKDQQEISLE
jgi:hypothetical protein